MTESRLQASKPGRHLNEVASISVYGGAFNCIGRNQPDISLWEWDFNISSSKLLVDHKVKIAQNAVLLPRFIDPDVENKVQRGITKVNEVNCRNLYKR